MYGLILLAILVGVLYWFVINKTRFGFDLRATGRSETAAVASGVKVKRMVLLSMLISGAAGRARRHAAALRAGLRLRRRPSRPVSASPASPSPCSVATTPSASPSPRCCSPTSTPRATRCRSTAGVSDRLVLVIQGVIVLSVVIAYEVVRRANVRLEQRRVASELARQAGAPTEGAVA